MEKNNEQRMLRVELDDVAGGGKLGDWLSKIFGEVTETFSGFSPMFGNPNP